MPRQRRLSSPALFFACWGLASLLAVPQGQAQVSAPPASRGAQGAAPAATPATSAGRPDQLVEPSSAAPVVAAVEAELLARLKPTPPTELFEIVEVIDGDTLHIMKGGQKVKLRLNCVDTEEKLSNRAVQDPSKPETVFGQTSAEWAKAYFPLRAAHAGRPQIGLIYPDGVERFDVYGRLLCHVILPDGLDFNLLLVRLGISPYFNKYGSSEHCHGEFQAAQAAARREQRGIWNPNTNRSADPNNPSAVRPYAELLPWWDARAAAVDRFRALRRENALSTVACDEPEALELASLQVGLGQRTRTFGTIFKIFLEDNGDQTLLMRSGDKQRSLRVVIPAGIKDKFDLADLERRAGEGFLQNYLFITGQVQRGERGFVMQLSSPEQIEVAGPEPRFEPEPTNAKSPETPADQAPPSRP
jgi:endonuclease YncB( thermonuclease family)